MIAAVVIVALVVCVVSMFLFDTHGALDRRPLLSTIVSLVAAVAAALVVLVITSSKVAQ